MQLTNALVDRVDLGLRNFETAMDSLTDRIIHSRQKVQKRIDKAKKTSKNVAIASAVTIAGIILFRKFR